MSDLVLSILGVYNKAAAWGNFGIFQPGLYFAMFLSQSD